MLPTTFNHEVALKIQFPEVVGVEQTLLPLAQSGHKMPFIIRAAKQRDASDAE